MATMRGASERKACESLEPPLGPTSGANRAACGGFGAPPEDLENVGVPATVGVLELLASGCEPTSGPQGDTLAANFCAFSM